MKRFSEIDVYVAEYRTAIGSGGRCVFSSLDPAIFYIVSGLGNDVDWDNFPDRSKNYPYEDRNGTENPQLTPVFQVVERPGRYGTPVSCSVTKMRASREWIVGNGIAEVSKKLFFKATGRDLVVLSGDGDRLQGEVR